ncbi:MAG: hypothetical protein ACI9EV_002080 [Urechidicola sp.]|jgi:hypothetical protein
MTLINGRFFLRGDAFGNGRLFIVALKPLQLKKIYKVDEA